MNHNPRKPWVIFPTFLSYTTAELNYSDAPKTQLQFNTTAGFSLFMWVFSSHSSCFPPVLLLQLGSEADGKSPPPSRYANTPFSLSFSPPHCADGWTRGSWLHGSERSRMLREKL